MRTIPIDNLDLNSDNVKRSLKAILQSLEKHSSDWLHELDFIGMREDMFSMYSHNYYITVHYHKNEDNPARYLTFRFIPTYDDSLVPIEFMSMYQTDGLATLYLLTNTIQEFVSEIALPEYVYPDNNLYYRYSSTGKHLETRDIKNILYDVLKAGWHWINQYRNHSKHYTLGVGLTRVNDFDYLSKYAMDGTFRYKIPFYLEMNKKEKNLRISFEWNKELHVITLALSIENIVPVIEAKILDRRR